jgi:hypothetical protein
LAENARLFALLGVANNDTLQTTFASKFHYGLWRPVTAIHEAGDDENPNTDADPSWTPLHPSTPPYPTYAGNAAGVGATFATVLSNYFGSDEISFDIQWPETVGGPRSYASFSEAAQETADSRIWGGIHFRFDSVAGQYAGSHVANYVLENYFQPVRPARPWFVDNGQALGSNKRALNSCDLLWVLQAGKYEDGIPDNSTWSEGDWAGNGDFDTSDRVLALQEGHDVAAAAPAATELAAAIDRVFALDKSQSRRR